jgi:glycine/D-amino acid oxidase-like deaminating enzyme/NADPH-dependent 2,4-dienoyl-CoA reductase/sulfur reductase-like enzyme
MTTGACQTLLRSYGRAPGRRVLVAGNGPLNLQVARELVRAGATVVAVAEAAPPPWATLRRGIDLIASHAGLALAGLSILADLRRRGVPLHWRHRIARVVGSERVEGAVLVDSSGREQTFSVDIVCVGEVFSSANELLRLLGCAHRARTDGAARVEVERDAAGATSLSDVFAVGEAGGFGGAHIAMAQGRLAASEALRRLGRSAPRDSRAERALRRHRRFQSALWTIFAAEEPGLSRARADTIVCRCEALSLGVLKRIAEANFVEDVATLKRLSRAGMGRCQGRYCSPRLAELVGKPATERDFLAPQAPLRPLPLAALAVERPEWGGHKRALAPPPPNTVGEEPLPISHASVVVIGAGVAGLSSALFLAGYGWDAVVLDRDRPNAGASGGNAGSLHAQLLSFDHGAKAISGGSPAAATLPLQRDSIVLWKELERQLDENFEIKITGGLMVAETERDMAFLAEKTRVERSNGVECQVVDASALRELEPALDAGFAGAAYCPLEGKINPLVATQGVLKAAVAAGARVFPMTNVVAIEKIPTGFAIHTNRGIIRAGRIVNAAGAFAAPIGMMLGLELPVFGAPLQMIVTEAAEPLLSRLVAHADRHLTLKQAANGNFIIGGGWTAELDPIHNHPRPSRSSLEGNLWVAQRVVPALRKLHVIRSWAAMNIDIDGAPILGEHPDMPGFFTVVTANGYTLAPLVGRITADLIVRGQSDRDVSPFSVSRFRS